MKNFLSGKNYSLIDIFIIGSVLAVLEYLL